jgi:hypothetical protein
MAENGKAGQNAPENQTTGVSDEGATDGAGGMNSWAWIGDMVNSGINTMTDSTLRKQRQRGADPCTFAASLEEGWFLHFGPTWWKASGAARKAGEALNRSINECISARGASKPTKYIGETSLADFAIEQYGLDNLLPEEAIATATGLALSPAGPAAALAMKIAFVREHLPTGKDIRRGDVDRRERGLPLGGNLYLYGPGLPANPAGFLGGQQRMRCINFGRYSGPGFADLVDDWVDLMRERVTPPGFSSARQKLSTFVGTWQGTSRWGIWTAADGFDPQSKLGFFQEAKEWMFSNLEEAQDLCEVQRRDQQRLKEQTIEAALEAERLAASRWWAASAALVLAAAVGGIRGFK